AGDEYYFRRTNPQRGLLRPSCLARRPSTSPSPMRPTAAPGRQAVTLRTSSTKIRASRRLFMTATPRYFSERIVRVAGADDFEIASMSDPTRFGTVFHALSFAQAIRQDLLTDYQVVIVGVDDAGLRDFAERGRFVTIDHEMVTDARRLASQIGVAKAMRDY